MTYESDEYSIRNKRMEYIGNYATKHKIRIDDIKPTSDTLAKNIDRLVILQKSKLWGQIDRVMDKAMIKYHALPSEEQIRVLPKEIKIEVAKFIGGFKNQSDNYRNFQSNPKPAMRINDESDKTTTVIDTDYFKAEPKVKIDFPYSSIGEIYKDKKLSTSEKSEMVDKYLAVKYSEIDTVDVVDDKSIVDDGKLYSWETEDRLEGVHYPEDDDLTTDTEILQKSKTPKEMFLTLCQMYPKRFMDADRGRGKKIGYLKTKEGRTYTPTLITVDPIEAKKYETACLRDSTTKYLPDAYFVKGLQAYMYFVRTTKE